MTSRPVIELLLCLLLALAVHVAALLMISAPGDTAPDPALALAPVTPELSALVAAWDRPPDADVPDAPKAPTAGAMPRPPRPEVPAPVAGNAPPAPPMPAAATALPAPEAASRPRPVLGDDAPVALRLPAPFSATELQSSRAALRAGPAAPRAAGPGLTAPRAGALPRVDLDPGAPPPPAPVTEAAEPRALAPAVPPETRPAPPPEEPPVTPDPPATPPQPEPEKIDPELGPPTAQAPASTQRPVARPFVRPAPFLLRPVARPAGLLTP